MNEPQLRALAFALANSFARPGGNEPGVAALQQFLEVLDVACQESGLELSYRRVMPGEDGQS